MKRRRFIKRTYGRVKARALKTRAAMRAEQIWQEAKKIFETGEELVRSA